MPKHLGKNLDLPIPLKLPVFLCHLLYCYESEGFNPVFWMSCNVKLKQGILHRSLKIYPLKRSVLWKVWRKTHKTTKVGGVILMINVVQIYFLRALIYRDKLRNSLAFVICLTLFSWNEYLIICLFVIKV